MTRQPLRIPYLQRILEAMFPMHPVDIYILEGDPEDNLYFDLMEPNGEEKVNKTFAAPANDEYWAFFDTKSDFSTYPHIVIPLSQYPQLN